MEEQATPKAENTSANEPVKKEEAVVSPAADKRADLYKKYEKLQSVAPTVIAAPAPDAEKDSKESESEPASVKAEDSASSSVKEETDKSKNLDKALHEERERRKEANRRLKDIQTQYESRIQELQSKVDQLMQQTTQPAADILPADEQLRKEVETLRRERALEQEKKKQEAAAQAQRSLQERISKTAHDLEEGGYPGFDLALVKVDAAIAKRVEEGDLLPEDASKPETWKKVYVEDVYESVAAKFKQTQKEDAIAKKLAAKKDAKLVSMPGSHPVKSEVKPEEDESMEAFNKKYFESRRANNPNSRRA